MRIEPVWLRRGRSQNGPLLQQKVAKETKLYAYLCDLCGLLFTLRNAHKKTVICEVVERSGGAISTCLPVTDNRC
jgi:hypothetical protein